MRFRSLTSSEKELIGGSPQGSLLGGLNYNIASYDNDASDEGCDDMFGYFH